MELTNSFEVPASPDAAWTLLLDVPRVVPCMPGAELTEIVDDSNWKATMKVKLGPMALTFGSDVTRELVNAEARRVRLQVTAREARGRGGAKATIESTLTPVTGGTRIDVVTELSLSGSIAQYGRGVVRDVSSQLTQSFADCLQRQLEAPTDGEKPALQSAPQAVPAAGLVLRAFAHRLTAIVLSPFRRQKR